MWSNATLPGHAGFRAWLDVQVEALPLGAVDGYVSLLLDPAQHSQAVGEIAAVAAMLRPGYAIEFSPTVHCLTPDLLLTEPEVHKTPYFIESSASEALMASSHKLRFASRLMSRR